MENNQELEVSEGTSTTQPPPQQQKQTGGQVWLKIKSKVSTKLHHVKKQLHKSAKRAKIFETQKQVKKVRFARTKVESKDAAPADVKSARERELQKAESDLEQIKAANLDVIVHHALLVALPTSSIPCSAHILEMWKAQEDTKHPFPPTLTHIETRVQTSKAMQEGVEDMLEELRCAVTGVRPKKKAVEKKKVVGSGASKVDLSTFGASALGLGTVGLTALGLLTPTKKRKRSSEITEVPSSRKSDSESSHTPSHEPPVSTFLTSLGGDISDSEYSDGGMSDFSDDGTGGGRGGLPSKKKSKKEPKNRAGQRARREKWEKLYGNQAKHVIEEEKKRLAERAAKARGAGGHGAGVGRAGASKPAEKLHPSWEAKRQQKSGATAFSGKKIVFGDDDSGGGVKPGSGAGSAETLHPSWEAKRKAKEAQAMIMKAAKPRKIVFDD